MGARRGPHDVNVDPCPPHLLRLESWSHRRSPQYDLLPFLLRYIYSYKESKICQPGLLLTGFWNEELTRSYVLFARICCLPRVCFPRPEDLSSEPSEPTLKETPTIFSVSKSPRPKSFATPQATCWVYSLHCSLDCGLFLPPRSPCRPEY